MVCEPLTVLVANRHEFPAASVRTEFFVVNIRGPGDMYKSVVAKVRSAISREEEGYEEGALVGIYEGVFAVLVVAAVWYSDC